jgi:hypothetical protein
MGDVEERKSPKPEDELNPRCGGAGCGAGAWVAVGNFAGTGSKKLPPPPKEVVVCAGAGAALGFARPVRMSNGEEGFRCCWGWAAVVVDVDEKLSPLNASFNPPNPEDSGFVDWMGGDCRPPNEEDD